MAYVPAVLDAREPLYPETRFALCAKVLHVLDCSTDKSLGLPTSLATTSIVLRDIEKGGDSVSYLGVVVQGWKERG